MSTLTTIALFAFLQTPADSIPVLGPDLSFVNPKLRPFIQEIMDDLSNSFGSKAPELHFITTSDSIPHKLSDHQGQTIFLNFWAPGCPPCIKEFPQISELQEDYEAAGLTVIFIDNMTVEYAKRFWNNYNVSGLKGSAREYKLVRPYQLGVIPMSILIDKDGFVRDGWLGAIGYDQMEAKLNKLIRHSEKSFRLKKPTLFIGLLLIGFSFIVVAILWSIKRAKTA